MAEPIRWGILGAANFAKNFMGPAIHAARGAKLAALASSSPDKAAEFQAFCPDLKLYQSYDELLADPDIDAVYVPLPNHLHVAWTKKALAAGKHVLTEKPIALKAEEIDELIALRDTTGLLTAEAFMIVHHPQWIRAKELFDSGAIGDLLHVDGFFSYDNRDALDNIRNRPETGGGGIRDIGVYTFGSARFVTGEEPESVSSQITYENGVDTVAHVQARFPSFSYNATVSMRMFPRQEMTFHGTQGIIRLTTPFNAGVFGPAHVELHQPGLAVRIERYPQDDHYINQVENFCRSVREGAAYPCPLEFSRGTQRMIDMVFAGDSAS